MHALCMDAVGRVAFPMFGAAPGGIMAISEGNLAAFKDGFSEADLFKTGEAKNIKHIKELFADDTTATDILKRAPQQ